MSSAMSSVPPSRGGSQLWAAACAPAVSVFAMVSGPQRASGFIARRVHGINTILACGLSFGLYRAARVIGTHLAFRPGGFHRRFKISVHRRILVFELDLPAAELEAR